MGLVRTSAPAIEPITLAEAKLHLDVIDDTKDALITMSIAAVRRHVEAICGRSLITQGWRLTLDYFPRVIRLERGPVQTVDSIVYTDMGGATQTITAPAAPAYSIDLSDHLARLTPGFGYTWPNTLSDIGVVKINFTAGYGLTAASVPEDIRNWMLLRISTLFDNPADVAVLQRGSVSALPHVDRMLDEYVIRTA
jgi:uncharacterized phiE125 gp8 family phage protein